MNQPPPQDPQNRRHDLPLEDNNNQEHQIHQNQLHQEQIQEQAQDEDFSQISEFPISDNQALLTDEELRDQVSAVFGLILNPLLIMFFLSSLSFEQSFMVYQNSIIERIMSLGSLITQLVTSFLYIYSFIIGLRNGWYNWKHFRIINYSAIGASVVLIGIYVYNFFSVGQFQDLKWSRMSLTLLMLTQMIHIIILKLYKESDTMLTSLFNKIYYLVIPLHEKEKEGSFASLSELYSKLSIMNKPLPLIYFLFQILFHLKMYHWCASQPYFPPPPLNPEPQNSNLIPLTDWSHFWKDQLKCVQLFSLLLICGFIGFNCQAVRISYLHLQRLPYILIFLYHTIYLVTYKVFLCTQLAGNKLNFEYILMPLFVITLVPLAASLFIKRGLYRLYRLPQEGEEQSQQQELIDLFQLFKLEEYSPKREQVRQEQKLLNGFIQLQQFSALLAIFFFCLVDISQLFPIQIQSSIGFYLQNIFDVLSGILIYMSIILCITSQGLFHVGEDILNKSEFGAFSFLLFSLYITKFLWSAIFLLSSFVLTAFFVNFTDSNAHFHLGPLISLLLAAFLYYIKFFLSQSYLLKFSNKVKQIMLQDRLQQIFQEHSFNVHLQMNPNRH